MAGDKTAALMACACSIGAVYVGGPPNARHGLAGFGAHAGLAFQLTDDLLGIWGAPEVTGKPVRCRPAGQEEVAAGRGRADQRHAAGRASWAPCSASGEPLSEDDLVRAATWSSAAGGKEWAESEADERAGVSRSRSLAEADLPARRAG